MATEYLAGTLGLSRLEWAVAKRPKEGEEGIGDAALVRETEDGCLLAVMDALGHGADAAQVAEQGVASLERGFRRTVLELLKDCHEALRMTRGVVLSLAGIHYADNTLTWLGVGNVNGVLLRAGMSGEGAREYLLCRGGTVGVQLPPPYAAITTIAPGDMLLLYTDGVDPDRVARFQDLLMPAERAAGLLLREGARGHDDALVLAARYRAPVELREDDRQ